MLPELEEFFSGIQGMPCWSVIGGAGSGSNLNLYFGRKVKRKRPLTNLSLSSDERVFEGEKCLAIYCDWRLQTAEEILCSSQSTEQNGVALESFSRIREKAVRSIAFLSQMHDLQIDFISGVSLVLFCDVELGNEMESNYVMFNERTSVAVTPSGRLVAESR